MNVSFGAKVEYMSKTLTKDQLIDRVNNVQNFYNQSTDYNSRSIRLENLKPEDGYNRVGLLTDNDANLYEANMYANQTFNDADTDEAFIKGAPRLFLNA